MKKLKRLVKKSYSLIKDKFALMNKKKELQFGYEGGSFGKASGFQLNSEKNQVISHNVKKTTKKALYHAVDFVDKNKIYVATVITFLIAVGAMGSRITGLSIVENKFDTCIKDYETLYQESSARNAILNNQLLTCNSELSLKTSETERLSRTLSNTTTQFTSCVNSLNSANTENIEFRSLLSDSASEINSLKKEAVSFIDTINELNLVINTAGKDYSTLVGHYARFKCCILKMNDASIKYYHIENNNVICTSESGENRFEFSC
ncbi:MAG: hypothetical protein PHW96_00450 [Candidatus Nanoarchaeia archaeon]|nr:hypothetical protein [Candidatus Nanoarchaeia archaeon]